MAHHYAVRGWVKHSKLIEQLLQTQKTNLEIAAEVAKVSGYTQRTCEVYIAEVLRLNGCTHRWQYLVKLLDLRKPLTADNFQSRKPKPMLERPRAVQ